MSDQRAEYLASGAGRPPADQERLSLIREVLSQNSTWAEPPPEVADRLLAAIGTEKGAPGASNGANSRRWIWPAAALLAVTAVVVMILGLLGVFSSPPQQVVPIAGTELQPNATGQAAIKETDAGWWIGLEVSDLPPAEDGTYYEGWVWNDDGEGVSIGTFHLRGGDQSVVLWSGVDPADYPAIWVTLENEDGDPSASERIVMWGRPEDT